MIDGIRHSALAASLLLFAGLAAAATPQPIERFARMPQIRDVVISPDGRYVAFISGLDDLSVVTTYDAHADGEYKRIAASEPGSFDVLRCTWANNERVACMLIGNIRGRNYAEPPFLRNMAVDADGANIKTLDVRSDKGNLLMGKTTPQNFNAGMNMRTGDSPADSQNYAQTTYGEKSYRMYELPGGQRSDQLIDILPEERDVVLIQTDDDGNGYPSVLGLNIYTGLRNVRIRQNPPIRQFVTDGRGNVRLGWGSTTRLNTHYFARVQDDWKPLARMAEFSERQILVPIAAAQGKNVVYAVGDSEGRHAIWTIDLTDERPPEVLFSHPHVDLGTPVLASDKRLLGMRYDLEMPFVYHVDEGLRATMKQINSQLPSHFAEVVDATADEKTLVIRAYSDVDEGTYYLYNREQRKLKKLGSAYPELRTDSLGSMKPIKFKASDGTEVPGYLTVPSHVRDPKGLPMVVLPHDGPMTRDRHQFSLLRNFFANRGYAVLQVNYRGSSGYGQKWRQAAYQDWGGVPQSDITDATRWAVAEGIADPKRVCIAGWGFGGYSALLGVARNRSLYKCAISIGGFSSLQKLRDNAAMLGGGEGARIRDQIGSDKTKLEQNSPVNFAADIESPVLLVHGDLDWEVQIDHSKDMASALKKARKEHKTLFLKGAGHELDRQSDRMEMLKAVEAFLAEHLGPGV